MLGNDTIVGLELHPNHRIQKGKGTQYNQNHRNKSDCKRAGMVTHACSPKGAGTETQRA